MAAYPTQNNPWPTQTPAPLPPKKRTVIRDPSSSSLATREVADWSIVQQAENNCQIFSGNNVFSCYPAADTVVAQHEWAAFVWNSRLPEFTQTNKVNIYLFHADSKEQVLSFLDQTNPTGAAGYLSAQVNDEWFGSRGIDWAGSNISYPFYWIITRNDKQLDGTESTQPVFQAVQTTYADSVVSSMASTSAAAASSASAASVSLASVASSAAAIASSTANVQSGASSSGFPHWAIAVIVVLGFLAIASTCILAFFIIRRIRRRNDTDSNRNSMGSNSPMMANVGHSTGSPLLAGAVMPERHSSLGHQAPSVVSPDGASSISRVGSLGESGPFSGADAAIMADAFRKALRKPDFADRPVEEGESPDNPPPATAEDELLSSSLAEEGRDIRSVSSSRGVKVETLSDSGETARDS